ncbi:phosphatidylserine decarboxylase family protein [Flavobacteriaceae bacterium]|nr:phosphatidylserine decarboxylase family protein [Flavobacteriaceae bacterium]
MFHKEGFNLIILFFILVATDVIMLEVLFDDSSSLKSILQIFSLIIFVFILWFFRNPKRNIIKNPELILSPADGKVIAIKEVDELEYFNDKKIQISIFLSPLDIHVNRYPVSGEILYSKYHKGEYLVAWHPKSSDKNERTTVVIKNKKFGEVMYRQIAGSVARRIVNYAKVNSNVEQGDDSGFIKFGSRVDLFLSKDLNLKIKVGDKIKGGLSIIA